MNAPHIVAIILLPILVPFSCSAWAEASRDGAPASLPVTGQSYWNGILKNIDAKHGAILEQLGRVGENNPELVAAFNLSLAYIGFLHSRLRETTGAADPIPFPDGFCERNRLICSCGKGDQPACKALAPNEAPGEYRLTCQEQRKRYWEALKREHEQMPADLMAATKAGKPVQVANPALFLKLHEAQTESERIRELMRRNGCLPLATL